MANKNKPAQKPGENAAGDRVSGGQNKVVVSGGISGGTLVVGNQNLVNVNQGGASAADLARLVAEIRGLLPQAKLDDDIRQEVDGDIQVVEAQLARPEPKKALVLPKLKGVLDMLVSAAAASEAVQKLIPMLQQAVAWAQQVLK